MKNFMTPANLISNMSRSQRDSYCDRWDALHCLPGCGPVLCAPMTISCQVKAPFLVHCSSSTLQLHFWLKVLLKNLVADYGEILQWCIK